MNRVAVLPRAEYARRPRLFDALARAFAVEFVPGDDEKSVSADSIVTFGVQLERVPVPSLCFIECRGREPRSARDVELTGTSALERPLRGAIIPDATAPAAPPLSPQPGDEVLASLDGRALWTVSRSSGSPVHTVSVAPRELGESESLRDQLKEREFVALLPLVHLLRETVDTPWPRPSLRACFVIDDPNLHASSYGYLDFRALAADATEVGYHVSIATIPFDQWLVHRRAARIFRSNPGALSLAIHGNDHTGQELARPLSEVDRVAMLAAALWRMNRLERRRGIGVSRVMVAPHETCSAEMMLDMARIGFTALCFGFGFRFPNQPLAGWEPADFVHALPVLPRRPITSHPGELALRAFLGQPLILGGHHDDLADGLDVLAQAAQSLDRLGDVQWLSLGDIAGSNVSMRLDGAELSVRLFSRHADVRVPEGVQQLSVELPSLHTTAADEVIAVKTANRTLRAQFGADGRASLDVGAVGDVELVLEHIRHVDPRTVPRNRTSPRAVVRRVATEARDRAKPLGRRARRLQLRLPRSTA